MEKVNLTEKFKLFNEYYSPKIVGEINESFVKVAKLKGDFPWHTHKEEDEMFFIVKGSLMIRFRDKDVSVNEGEFIIVPKGIEHQPVAAEEAHVMFIEPKTTVNTGSEINERTIETLEKI
jgi:mannose-6-phosphate isomerase-like protein (cupin superfamily)